MEHTNNNPYVMDSNGRYRPLCSGWGVFPNGKKCKGCPDCKNNYSTTKPNKMATTKSKKKAPAKRKSTAKAKPTEKQLAARKKFAVRSKKANKLVADGKVKTLKQAWKQV